MRVIKYSLLTIMLSMVFPMAGSLSGGAKPPAKLTFRHGESTLVSIRFLQDRKRLISASFDGTVVMWNLQNGKRAWEVDLDATTKTKGTISQILDMDLSPNGKMLAVAYDRSRVVGQALEGKPEYRIGLLDSNDGSELRVLTGHTALIGTLAFSPDGRFLASASSDSTARLWKVETGQQVWSIELKEPGSKVSFSRDGRFIAAATNAGTGPEPVGLYAVETGRLIASFPPARRNVVAVTFLPNGHSLAVASNDPSAAQVDFWDITDNKLKKSIKDDTGITFSPDGRLRASSGSLYEHRVVVVRDVATNEKRVTRKLPADLSTLDFSSDSKILAVGTEKGQIVLIPV